MNSGLKWKLIAGFLLVFVAGGLTGGFIAATTTRHFLFGGGHHPGAERMREHLKSELDLTPEQMSKISPIVDKMAAQLEQIRTDTSRRVRETFSDAHRQIAENLTPEQKTKFDQMRERHRRFLRGHHRHGGPPPPEPPP